MSAKAFTSIGYIPEGQGYVDPYPDGYVGRVVYNPSEYELAALIKGDPGVPGPANSLTVGTVTTGEEAAAVITGITPAQVLNLVLPAGGPGPAGEVTASQAIALAIAL